MKNIEHLNLNHPYEVIGINKRGKSYFWFELCTPEGGISNISDCCCDLVIDEKATKMKFTVEKISKVTFGDDSWEEIDKSVLTGNKDQVIRALTCIGWSSMKTNQG